MSLRYESRVEGRVLMRIEEERVPFKEGWRRSEKPITQGDMNHMILKLIEENEHKVAEAKDVGFGTVQAVQNAVTSLLPTHCNIM